MKHRIKILKFKKAIRILTRSLVIVGVVMGLSPLAFGHNTSVEPQAFTSDPEASDNLSNPNRNYNTMGAKVIPDPRANETVHLGDDGELKIPKYEDMGVEQSRAIFAYLAPDEVDFFRLDVKESDFLNGFPDFLPFPAVRIDASALPYACEETIDHYPVTAFLGPGVPTSIPSGITLPQEVADKLASLQNMDPTVGIIVADNPPVANRALNVFESPEEGVEASWFLPEGLTQFCLLEAPFLCDFSNTISYLLTEDTGYPVGEYTFFLAMWDPAALTRDYTANIGADERFTASNVKQKKSLDIINDRALMSKHGVDCTPVPVEPAP